METAKILKKSILKPGNNWINLLNSANLIKKNAVTPVNFHLYHYAGNNPVRYTDPDGRAEVWSQKTGDGKYKYKADQSTIDSAVRSSYGLIPIPFIGEAFLSFVDYICDFKKIDISVGYARLAKVPSQILGTFYFNNCSNKTDDISENEMQEKLKRVYTKLQSVPGPAISAFSYYDKIAKYMGISSQYTKILSRVADFCSVMLAISNIASDLVLEIEENAVNIIIGDLFGAELISNSHENVSALYVFAKCRTLELIKNGYIHFDYDTQGRVPWSSENPEKTEQVRQELRLLKQFLEAQ